MSTGDLKNNVRRLQTELKSSRFSGDPDIRGLVAGSPPAYLPLLHFALLSYSYPLAVHLAERGYDLYGKSDARFTDVLYKLLRDEFSYQPRLTKSQFLSRSGFAEHKSIFVSDVLRLCREHHAKLTKQGPAPAKPISGRTLASLSQAKPPVRIPPTMQFNSHKTENQPISSRRNTSQKTSLPNARAPLRVKVSDNPKTTTSKPHKGAVKPVRVFSHDDENDENASSLPPRASSKQQSNAPTTSGAPPTAFHRREDKENTDDFASSPASLTGQFDLHSNCMPGPGLGANPETRHPLAQKQPALVNMRYPSDPVVVDRHDTHVEQSAHPNSSSDRRQALSRGQHQAMSLHGVIDASRPNSTALSRPVPLMSHGLPSSGQPTSTTHPLAGNLNPSPTAPQPSVSRFRSGFSRNTQLDVAQPATAFPAVDERTSHFRRHGDLMMPPRDHDLLASNPASHRSSDSDISRQSTRDTQVPHQLSDEREQRSQPRHQLRDEPAQLPHYPPALPAVSHRKPDLRGDNVFDLKTSDQGRLQPAQREPAFVRVESEKEVFLPEKDSHTGKLMLTDLPRHSMSEGAKLTAAVSKDFDQFRLQLDTITTQLGHLGGKLNQLLIADQSKPAPPPADHGTVQRVPAEVELSGSHIGRILETMNARMILLETRLQQLESQRAPDVSSDHQRALPLSSTSSAQQANQPLIPTNALTNGLGSSLPGVVSLDSRRAASVPVSDGQVLPATSIGGGLADDPRVQTGVTPCRTVIAERRAISVSTPHGGDDNTRALSTVSMDISYVFSDPKMQAYVSGVNDRLRQTRNILRSMTGPHVVVSSTLEQQLLLASAMNSQT